MNPPRDQLTESLIKLIADSTEAQTQVVENQRTIAHQLATVSQNGATMAATLERAVEKLDAAERRTPMAVTDIKDHVSDAAATITAAMVAAIVKSGPSRLVGWLIAGAAVVTSAGITGLVLLKVHG